MRELPWIAAGLLSAAIAGCAGTPPVPVDPTRVADAARFPATPEPESAGRPPPGVVAIRIDETRLYQVVEGFGATVTEHIDPATRRDLMGALRPRVAEAVFGQVGITMGHLDVGPYENFDAARYTTANDDDDPFHINWAAFNFVRSHGQKTGVLDLARPYGFDNFMIHSGTNVRWSDPWLAEVRRVSYARYLDEMAENVVAPLIYWRERLGIVPNRWHHLFNEPTTGNRELETSNVQELVDLVRTVGARLEREGFGHLKLAVASEETEEASFTAARAILADPDARRYVGAITFHTYPYGSIYSEVRNILATSGKGRPDGGRLRVRADIANLAFQHGVQVWMTEVSHGRADSFDSMLGRAIHIHDELRHAYASSFWAMFQAWGSPGIRGSCDEDCLVHFDSDAGTVRISGTGYAMGHYARWVRRGAIRVAAETGDPLVLATAFRDDANRRIVVVAINNHALPVNAFVATNAPDAIAGETRGEQSSEAGYWLPVAPDRGAEGSLRLVLPSRSVTTLSAGMR